VIEVSIALHMYKCVQVVMVYFSVIEEFLTC
jgi:hypothetical protein